MEKGNSKQAQYQPIVIINKLKSTIKYDSIRHIMKAKNGLDRKFI